MRLRLSPNLPPVLVDSVQIQQVILNLARNSIDALGGCETRRIVIATARFGDSIEITHGAHLIGLFAHAGLPGTYPIATPCRTWRIRTMKCDYR